MRLIAGTLLTLAIVIPEGHLRAEPSTNNHTGISSDAVDARLIQRNSLLRELVGIDPGLVKTIVMLIRLERNFHPVDGIDAKRNPDLVGSNKASQTTTEWYELLTRAQAESLRSVRQGIPKMQSPEGSLEFIEMVRKARESKNAASK
jgi:hypothetical protein